MSIPRRARDTEVRTGTAASRSRMNFDVSDTAEDGLISPKQKAQSLIASPLPPSHLIPSSASCSSHSLQPHSTSAIPNSRGHVSVSSFLPPVGKDKDREPPRNGITADNSVTDELNRLNVRITALERLVQSSSSTISALKESNESLKNNVLLWQLGQVKAQSKPVSVLKEQQRDESTSPGAPKPNLLTVLQLEGFDRHIVAWITPDTGNRRFAGKAGWNKLQKTCRTLRHYQVSLELDPSVRVVPDNFPTIRRAVQNIDPNDQYDFAKIVVRPCPEPYVEKIDIDRKVFLSSPHPQNGDDATMKPLISGRLSISPGADGTVIRRLAVAHSNPLDPWGSALDICGAEDVVIEDCELSCEAHDEVVVNLRSHCIATVQRNRISGGNSSQGITGVNIDDATTVRVIENTITCTELALSILPSAIVTIAGNTITKNKTSIRLDEDGIETIVDKGGFGRIMLRNNVFEENQDVMTDITFLKSLEVLLHPLLRQRSMSSELRLACIPEGGGEAFLRGPDGDVGSFLTPRPPSTERINHGVPTPRPQPVVVQAAGTRLAQLREEQSISPRVSRDGRGRSDFRRSSWEATHRSNSGSCRSQDLELSI